MNSFNLLRLLAAIAVIYHHCYPATGRPPVRWMDTNPGELGVAVFFVVSGYLVTASLQRSTSIRDYLMKRILRVEPALLVSVAVTALVIGAALTTLPLATYFRSPQVYLYVVRNALMYPVTYDLPGVFANNPLPHIVNASLWTLRLEFSCYLGLAALAWGGLLNRWVVAGLSAAAGAAFVVLHVGRPDLAAAGALHQVYYAALDGFLFLGGSLVQLSERRHAGWLAFAGLPLLLTPLWPFALPALVVTIGEMRSFRLPADVSYGLYIYAFPLQQILAGAGVLSFWTALAATVPFAIASWFIVERPALRLKPKPAPEPRHPSPAHRKPLLAGPAAT